MVLRANSADLQLAAKALEAAGIIYYQPSGVDMFLDGPNASPRDAVHAIPAREKVRPQCFQIHQVKLTGLFCLAYGRGQLAVLTGQSYSNPC